MIKRARVTHREFHQIYELHEPQERFRRKFDFISDSLP